MKKYSRRNIIKSAALGSSALSLSSLNPFIPGLIPQAYSQGADKHNCHLMIIYLRGGYSASFSDAGKFLNGFYGGINNGNILALSNNLSVHNSFAQLPTNVLAQMATVGLYHGQTAHGPAISQNFVENGNISAAHILAAGMGGPSASKLVLLAPANPMRVNGGNVSGTSLQVMTDMQASIDALGGGEPNRYSPDRDLAAKGVESASKQSTTTINGNSESLVSLRNGFETAVNTLKLPAQPFNADTLVADYGLNGTAVQDNNLPAQLAMAEVMFRADTNIAIAQSRGPWDNHGDPQMQRVFTAFNQDIMPGLQTFCRRVYGDADNNVLPQDAFANKNVVTVIIGDFMRSSRDDQPTSRHGAGGAITVIGPKLKNGSTCTIGEFGVIPPTVPNASAFWAFLGTVLNAPQATITELVNLGGGGTNAGLELHKALLR